MKLYCWCVQVSDTHATAPLEGEKGGNDLVQADIGLKCGFSVGENHDRAVGSTTATRCLISEESCVDERMNLPELAFGFKGRGEGNSIVEGQTKGFMGFVATLVAEQVVLEILLDGKERTARSVHNGVAVTAVSTLGVCDDGR